MKQSSALWQEVDCLICPHCGQVLRRMENSLRCVNNHSFDLAKQGYVNLALQCKASENYSRERFRARRDILEKGYYSHILRAIQERIDGLGIRSLLDAGCGEGYYSRHIRCAQKLACDLSKDAVLLAAKADESTHYFVGDIAKLPLTDGAVDAVLDVFSPAHYGEFVRVARPGWLIKLVPGTQHLQELRALLPRLRDPEQEAGKAAAELFCRRYPGLWQATLSCSYALPKEDLLAFARMTPLFFHVDLETLELDSIAQLTIEARMLVAKITESKGS